MTTTDMIRAVLDLIDTFDKDHKEGNKESPPKDNEELRRFEQIAAVLANRGPQYYSNSPNEIVTNVDSVTTGAGGGLNGPKHVDDLRVKDPRGWS
jgi:hypothetical protein